MHPSSHLVATLHRLEEACRALRRVEAAGAAWRRSEEARARARLLLAVDWVGLQTLEGAGLRRHPLRGTTLQAAAGVALVLTRSFDRRGGKSVTDEALGCVVFE